MKNSPEGHNSISELAEERPRSLGDSSKQTVQSEAHKAGWKHLKGLSSWETKCFIKGLPEGEDREKGPNIYIWRNNAWQLPK